MRTSQQPSGNLSYHSARRATFALPLITITFKVTWADTMNTYAFIEYVAPPYSPGTGTHWHANASECLYVVEGMLAFALGEQTIMASAGAMIMVPPTLVHGFWNPASAPVTVLSMFVAHGPERFFAEHDALLKSTEYRSNPTHAEECVLTARLNTALRNELR